MTTWVTCSGSSFFFLRFDFWVTQPYIGRGLGGSRCDVVFGDYHDDVAGAQLRLAAPFELVRFVPGEEVRLYLVILGLQVFCDLPDMSLLGRS